MNIIILGCGLIGSTLAQQLYKEGHNLTLIDQKNDVLRKFAQELDVLGICGNGVMLETQKEAGISEADMFIACTDSDEVNMLAALIAKKEGHCYTIARVRNPEFMEESEYLREHIGLSMIVNPEALAAREIVRLLEFPYAEEMDSFNHGLIHLIKLRIREDSTIANLKLRELSSKIKTKVLIAGIVRNNDFMIPGGDTVLLPGDLISVLARPWEIDNFSSECKFAKTRTESAFIVGAGRIAYYLSKEVKKEKWKCDLKIIEINPDAARSFAEKTDNVTVIKGDGSDEALLLSEGIEKSDAFVSLTDSDSENIFMSYLAAKLSKARIITKVKTLRTDIIPEQTRVGSLVKPANVVADEIVRFVRGISASKESDFESLHKLADGKGEALEFIVSDESAMVEMPLSEMPLRKDVLIAAIIRKNVVIHPSGSDVLKTGDHVIIFTTNHGFYTLQDIIAKEQEV